MRVMVLLLRLKRCVLSRIYCGNNTIKLLEYVVNFQIPHRNRSGEDNDSDARSILSNTNDAIACASIVEKKKIRYVEKVHVYRYLLFGVLRVDVELSR
jgi:hypothetical protein